MKNAANWKAPVFGKKGDYLDQKGRQGEEVWKITSGRGNDVMKEGWI